MGIKSKCVQIVTVIDPDTGLPCEVEIRKLENGTLIGFDGAFLADMDDDDRIRNPYGPGLIEVPDDEASSVVQPAVVIEVCKRMDGKSFHAKVANGSEAGDWGAGSTPQEAVGALAFGTPNLFKIDILTDKIR